MIIHILCQLWTNKRRGLELALTAFWLQIFFSFASSGALGVVRGAKRWSLLTTRLLYFRLLSTITGRQRGAERQSYKILEPPL